MRYFSNHVSKPKLVSDFFSIFFKLLQFARIRDSRSAENTLSRVALIPLVLMAVALVLMG